jgi:hypothetical protein
MESISELGGAYKNDTNTDGAKVLAGERSFLVKDIEVFSITF